MIADMCVAPQIATLAAAVLLVPSQSAAKPHGPQAPAGPQYSYAATATAPLTLGTLARRLRLIAAAPERWWGLVRFDRDRSVKIMVEECASYQAWLMIAPPGDAGQAVTAT